MRRSKCHVPVSTTVTEYAGRRLYGVITEAHIRQEQQKLAGNAAGRIEWQEERGGDITEWQRRCEET